MESGAVRSSDERNIISKDSSWFSQFRNASNPWMARYVYGFIFLVSNVLAWAARDYVRRRGAFTLMKRLEGCHGVQNCLGAEGVLRVSLGCFIFYIIMFLSTADTFKLHGMRDSWHSGWWSAKIVLWIALTILSFLLPADFIQFYGQIAHFGAGVFLLIQLISIVNFIIWLNDYLHAEKKPGKCRIRVMLLATAAHIVCLAGIVFMYVWYAPQTSCVLNIFFVTSTLVLIQIMTSVSLHPKVNAGILTPALMGLYIVFICWSAIRSEPANEKCVLRSDATTKTDWLSIISFIVGVLAIVIATFSTGIDSKCFQFGKDEVPAEDDVPYAYGFFHFVFAAGAMYFAMLLIGWSDHHTMRKLTIDVGWASTWVKMVNEWLAVCVYLWLLVSPVIWKRIQANSTQENPTTTNYLYSLLFSLGSST